MNADDQALLHSVYELFHRDSAVKQAGCIIQFLWRDVTSLYDIVRPYYTSSETFNDKIYSFTCF